LNQIRGIGEDPHWPGDTCNLFECGDRATQFHLVVRGVRRSATELGHKIIGRNDDGAPATRTGIAFGGAVGKNGCAIHWHKSTSTAGAPIAVALKLLRVPLAVFIAEIFRTFARPVLLKSWLALS